MAVNITQLDPNTLNTQTYESQDINLIPSFEVDTTFTDKNRIEFFIYDLDQSLIFSELNYTQYSIFNDGQSSLTNNISQITLDPTKDLENLGFTQGEYITYYNFLNNEIGSNIEPLYISEISSDRTELRLDSTVLSPQDIVEFTNNFIQKRESSEYFFDFYLNLGDNVKLISNNILLDNEDPSDPTILIKLYEPLPLNINLNSTLWVISTIDESLSYQISFIEEPTIFDDTIKIQGPNFNIEIKDRVNNSTQELSYSDILNSPLTTSQNQINSLLEEKELDINIDYTNFSDFIHFSSAKTRLENFYYKASLIEQYSSSISLIDSNITGSTSSSFAVNESKTIFENKISDIITNFDGYDYYLYYSSGSFAWPKITIEPPYLLDSTGSAAVITWYNNIIQSASLFDNSNKDNLLFSIPEYLRDDSDNKPYELFIDMVAQHFDNIWIYYKDVTQKYNNDNRLDHGVSKDIVADAIRDFGVKLYQNNFSNEDLYTAFLGLTPEGALFPFPNITGSLPTPTGFEYIDTLISASNDYIPLDDVNKSLYKRIYHNLPYLLKAKGTIPGLRALITSYGIPDTILRINEYGGKDKVDSNDWDYWQNEFNYAFKTDGDNFISSSFFPELEWGTLDGVPDSLMFRFKTNGLPQYNIPYSQSLVSLKEESAIGSQIYLTYTGSGYNSGSYGGSIIDPYYQYATLTLLPDPIGFPNLSASVYLPFFDGGWWSVMVNRTGSDFSLYASNKIYNGGDNGTSIGFISSSSISSSPSGWNSSYPIYFATSSLINGNLYNPFSGSLQEIRYYTSPRNESVFKDYVMNPHSIEGNSLNSGPDELIFRASLGGELYTGSNSIHPKVTGSWIPTSSFTSDSNFYFNSTPVFVPNTEYFFYDQPVAGIKNSISDKIRLENNVLPSGNTLSPFRRLEQVTEASSSYTPNINYLEVAFSPQNEINEDIMDQLGFFNIGDYIGDPAERFSGTSYPNLDNLRNAYFEKYTKNYNLVDFIRLIKFFDNSLFKMIKDFVPARTSLASGVVIKQHLLERNKYPQPQMEWEDITYTGSIEIGDIEGGTGGSFEIFNGINTSPYGPNGTGPENIFDITQSWVETIPSLLGEISTIHDSQEEFYDGEFSGSVILVTTQSLNQPYAIENVALNYTQVQYFPAIFGLLAFDQPQLLNNFLSPNTIPNNGEVLLFTEYRRIFTFPIFQANWRVKYLKISKLDSLGNDNTIPLGQLNKILIYKSNTNSYIEFNIGNISEHSTYYFYEVSNPNWVPQYPLSYPDNKILDYTISASRNTPPVTITPGMGSIPIQSLTESIDNLNYLDPTSGIITFNDTPNTPIIISASLNLDSPTNSNLGSIALIKNGDVTEENAGSSVISQQFTLNSGSNTILFTGSFQPLNLDNYYIRLFNGSSPSDTGNIIFNSIDLFITQSRITQSPPPTPTLIEPYITTPNFYNSDQNALLNDVFENRSSTIYQDIDYNTGVLTPTNFDLLLNGSAVKATVQDSNYTTARHIIPRYEGSKSTSQFLNKWTIGDQGTFGKTPTVESSKNHVAYCDFIGGWPPERMNASGAHILYLIKDDGTVVIPNTSENSLNINKGTFESGERVLIESKTTSTSGDNNFRNIIRGGTRIEPILYTQIGHTPPSWSTGSNAISFSNIDPSIIGSYSNVAGRYNRSTTQIIPFESSSVIVQFPNTTLGTPLSTHILPNTSYVVSQSVIDEAIDLYIGVKINFNYVAPPNQTYLPNVSPISYLGVFIRKVDSSGNNPVTLFSKNITTGPNPSSFIYYNTDYTIFTPGLGEESNIGPGFAYSISSMSSQQGFFKVPSTLLSAGDKIFIQFFIDPAPFQNETPQIKIGSTFIVNQYPTPIPSINIPSPYNSNTLWGYPDPTTYPNVITSSNPGLVEAYGNLLIKQTDIPGSGFNPVSIPWSIKYGDEFRFEGMETYTFTVSKIFPPELSSVERISPTGSIEVHFDRNLPVSANTSIFNLDHFLIRRYVDDASLILLEGFKPIGSQGPFIIKPEYCSPGLNKNIDQFILDLTERGLL
jgi:hypothetical protein